MLFLTHVDGNTKIKVHILKTVLILADVFLVISGVQVA